MNQDPRVEPTTARDQLYHYWPNVDPRCLESEEFAATVLRVLLWSRNERYPATALLREIDPGAHWVHFLTEGRAEARLRQSLAGWSRAPRERRSGPVRHWPAAEPNPPEATTARGLLLHYWPYVHPRCLADDDTAGRVLWTFLWLEGEPYPATCAPPGKANEPPGQRSAVTLLRVVDPHAHSTQFVNEFQASKRLRQWLRFMNRSPREPAHTETPANTPLRRGVQRFGLYVLAVLGLLALVPPWIADFHPTTARYPAMSVPLPWPNPSFAVDGLQYHAFEGFVGLWSPPQPTPERLLGVRVMGYWTTRVDVVRLCLLALGVAVVGGAVLALAGSAWRTVWPELRGALASGGGHSPVSRSSPRTLNWKVGEP